MNKKQRLAEEFANPAGIDRLILSNSVRFRMDNDANYFKAGWDKVIEEMERELKINPGWNDRTDNQIRGFISKFKFT